MNNIIKSISTLFLIFNCFALSAQNLPQQLAGTWIFDFETSVAHMDVKAKKILQKIPSAQQKLEKAYRNRQITFGNDGRYLLRLADGEQTIGNWAVNSSIQQSTITLTSSQNHIQNLDIIIISNNGLVLKLQDNGHGNPMICTWYFTKN